MNPPNAAQHDSPRSLAPPSPRWIGLPITIVRVIVQTAFFAFFVLLVLLTTFTQLERFPGLRDLASKYLEIDPLIALATALTTHTIYKGLLWSLTILIPTIFLGRFFCNWICPYGTLHQFVGWLGRATRKRKHAESEEQHPNRYRPSQRLKYVLLIALLVAALCGSLQIGLIDPLCLFHRSLTGAVVPSLALPAPALLGPARTHHGAWIIGFILFALVALNLVYPRFFCRVLCPLGAFLGWLSRFIWWRIDRDPAKCHGCDRCRDHCEGACDPHAKLRTAECTLCLNCIADCPEGALRFVFMPPREREIPAPDASRRKLLFAGVTGLLFYAFARVSRKNPAWSAANVIRPPGARPEPEFLERCVKCDQCLKACPTNVIQPAWLESGVEGIWTPRLDFEIGHCQLHCVTCSTVCPTGALRPLTIAEKLGLESFADRGPLKLGLAVLDTGICIPHSCGVPCVVCEEVCPTSPKAIATVTETRRTPAGDITVVLPFVVPDRCIGCGLCENQCPTIPRRAIRVVPQT